jgi:FtsP/CotA-like multicopper oxidase with cupredoxin domain
VNGVPWPKRSVQPRAYRFRMLNIGITRTYTFSMDAGRSKHNFCQSNYPSRQMSQ